MIYKLFKNYIIKFFIIFIILNLNFIFPIEDYISKIYLSFINTIILLVIFCYFITRRISLIISTINNIKRGDLSKRIKIYHNDEIGILSEKINLMIESIEKKNNELNLFSKTLAHDLTTPLRIIQGMSEILVEDYSDNINEDAKKILKIIQNYVINMSRLIDAAQANAIAGKKMTIEPIKISSIVKYSIENFDNKKIKEAKIKYSEKSNDIKVYADMIQITRVLNNLISNAIKFSKPKPKINISWEVLDKEVKISVKDNGIGINKDYHEKIFILFERIDKRVRGTGMGLSICKKIIEEHGGKIGVQNNAKKGSTFWFTLKKVAD